VGWSTGKVYHIVKVLEDDGLVRTIKTEERGRIKRNVYPTSWKELLPEDVKNTLKIV
jgi:DNA-binding PadR family transcriptional regulator